MPVFNAEATVTEAVQSILSSSLTDLELVVVNDGSTDDTVALINSIQDPRITLIHQDHAGVSDAHNLGISHSRADYIARMDGDDIASPDRLGKQLELLLQESCDIVSCRVAITDLEGNPIDSLRRYENWSNALLSTEEILAHRFVESPLVHPTTLARREVWELGCRKGPFPEDYDFWLRAFAAGYRPIKHPDVLLQWRDRPERLTRTAEQFTREAFDRCRKEHLLIGPLNDMAKVDFWGVGQSGKPWVRWIQSKGISIRHLVDVHPRKIGTRILDVDVISPDQLPSPDGTPLLVAVGAEGARELIEDHLLAKGHRPGRDAWFLC